MGFWNFLASLVYAFLDFIVFELTTTSVFKINKQNAVQIGTVKGKFKPSEYFIFGIIFLALFYFYLSNLLQDWAISNLANLKGWLFLILAGLFSISVLYLALVVLKRKWSFRIVIIFLIVLSQVIAISILGILIKMQILPL